MRRAALAETAAHVAYLRDEGRLRVSADGDGPVPFVAGRYVRSTAGAERPA
jgi:hypothetical protein